MSAADRRNAEQLDATDPLAELRSGFVVDDGWIYVDGNSLGRLHRTVAGRLGDAVDDWGRRLVTGWRDWIDLPEAVGDRLGSTLLGAGLGQVLVTDTVTVNLYKLASAALAVRPDRRAVVVDADDFPTDRYVIEGLAAQHGLDYCVMHDAPLEGHHPEDIASMCDACEPALVVLSHANYRTGALLEMARITRLVQERGALMLWDLSHSVGALPIDLDGCGVDLAVGCTYKYVNAGPGAPAFLYVNDRLLADTRSPIWGWFGQRDQFAMGPGYEPATGVTRFLAGSPPILGIVAVDAALDVLAGAGVERLDGKARALTALVVELFDAWLAPLGFELGTPRDPDRRGSHVSLRHRDAWQLCRALIERAGVIPDFRAPDSVRLGLPPLYTRFVDAWDAVDRLRSLVATGEYHEVDDSPARIT